MKPNHLLWWYGEVNCLFFSPKMCNTYKKNCMINTIVSGGFQQLVASKLNWKRGWPNRLWRISSSLCVKVLALGTSILTRLWHAGQTTANMSSFFDLNRLSNAGLLQLAFCSQQFKFHLIMRFHAFFFLFSFLCSLP